MMTLLLLLNILLFQGCCAFRIGKFSYGSSLVMKVDGEAPFIQALIAATKTIGHRYFFPGHHGGLLAPPDLTKALKEPDSVLKIDLPELDETDNVHAPEGPLLESLEASSRLFGAKRSWYLVNGSTSGIHVAMMAIAKAFRSRHRGSGLIPSFLIPRDCHKSVIDGLRLSRSEALLFPCEVMKGWDVSIGPSLDRIESFLKENAQSSHPHPIAGIVLTRPSYAGVMTVGSRLKRFIQICHDHGVAVLVDEAHGAHLAFLAPVSTFTSALSCGADIVVQSAHKSLLGVTQTALLHLSSNSTLVSQNVLREIYSMLTTTSPNAWLLASLDASQAYLSRKDGQDTLKESVTAALELKRYIQTQLSPYVEVLESTSTDRVVDPLKLSLRFLAPEKGVFDSLQIDDIMCSEDGIYCELNLPGCLTYILGIGCNESTLLPLKNAITKAVARIAALPDLSTTSSLYEQQAVRQEPASLGGLAFLAEVSTYEDLEVKALSTGPELIGKIAAETICPYPPGVPLVIAGEVIDILHFEKLKELRDALAARLERDRTGLSSHSLGSGCTVTGCSDLTLETIQVYFPSS